MRRLRRLGLMAALGVALLAISTAAVYRDALRAPTTLTREQAIADLTAMLPDNGAGYLVTDAQYVPIGSTVTWDMSDPKMETSGYISAGYGSECYVVNPIPLRWPCLESPTWIVFLDGPTACKAVVVINAYDGLPGTASGCGDFPERLNLPPFSPSFGHAGWY